jgi:hypothetical protein
VQDSGPTTGLLSRLPDVEIDDVAVRRLRQRILDDAAAPEIVLRTPSRWILAVPALAFIVVGSSIALWSLGHSRRQPPALFASVFTNDDPAARWSRHLDLGAEWIELTEGHFRVEIREHSATRRVFVTVPDGHIDDLGTIFDVVISGGVTTEVRVAEGRVAIHLRGRADVILADGERWERPVEAARDLAPDPVDVGPGRAANTSSAGASRAKTGAHKRRTNSAGRIGTVADQESEDAAYLKVIYLLRASRTTEAMAAARDYLRRFPAGFRREEMATLIK